MKHRSKAQGFGQVTFSLMLASIMLLSGAVPTLAAEGTLPLEHAYKRLTHVAEGQTMRLNHATDIVEHTQKWVDALAEEGKDVSGLQAALEEFKVAIDEAQTYSEKANTTLATHAGFDSEGKVTNQEQAKETLQEVAQNLRDARRKLQDGTIAFRRATEDWRRDRRPQARNDTE